MRLLLYTFRIAPKIHQIVITHCNQTLNRDLLPVISVSFVFVGETLKALSRPKKQYKLLILSLDCCEGVVKKKSIKITRRHANTSNINKNKITEIITSPGMR